MEHQGYMNVQTLALLSTIAFSGCIHSDRNAAIADAKKEIAKDLRDPESAQYRKENAARMPRGFLVCGEINSKNGFGGYTGFKPFLFYTGKLIVIDEESLSKNELDAIDALSAVDLCMAGEKINERYDERF